MIVTEAAVPTQRASRYLVQLGQHLEHLRDRPHTHPGQAPDSPTVTIVEWTDTDATITFNWGGCALHASADTLRLRLEAADNENLHRLQELMTHRLESISRRDHLRVNWQPAVTSTR